MPSLPLLLSNSMLAAPLLKPRAPGPSFRLSCSSQQSQGMVISKAQLSQLLSPRTPNHQGAEHQRSHWTYFIRGPRWEDN